MNQSSNSPTVLLILDGWGHREETKDNAIANGNTPVWDRLWESAPHTLISSSGLDVGLPDGQMGNSEVGHMSLGSGRVVFQSITRIDQAIADGSFTRRSTQPRTPDCGGYQTRSRARCNKNLPARLPRWARHTAAQCRQILTSHGRVVRNTGLRACRQRCRALLRHGQGQSLGQKHWRPPTSAMKTTNLSLPAQFAKRARTR